MRTAKSEHKRGEDWGHEAAVHQEVGGAANEGIEEDANRHEAKGRQDKALTGREYDGMLQFAQGDAGEEGADVGEGGVLEEADELGGAVAVDGADDMVGIEVEIEGVGDETDGPER